MNIFKEKDIIIKVLKTRGLKNFKKAQQFKTTG